MNAAFSPKKRFIDEAYKDDLIEYKAQKKDALGPNGRIFLKIDDEIIRATRNPELAATFEKINTLLQDHRDEMDGSELLLLYKAQLEIMESNNGNLTPVSAEKLKQEDVKPNEEAIVEDPVKNIDPPEDFLEKFRKINETIKEWRAELIPQSPAIYKDDAIPQTVDKPKGDIIPEKIMIREKQVEKSDESSVVNLLKSIYRNGKIEFNYNERQISITVPRGRAEEVIQYIKRVNDRLCETNTECGDFLNIQTMSNSQISSEVIIKFTASSEKKNHYVFIKDEIFKLKND